MTKQSEVKTARECAVNRRRFLTAASSLGALASTATFSNSELTTVYPKPTATRGNCGFSALEQGFIYLNSGTEGSMPSCVLETLNQRLAQWAGKPTESYETDEILGKHQHFNREKVARFLAVGKNNICMTDNTTMGLSMVLMGLNFQPGDTAILTNHEHNAIKSPLMVQQERVGLRLIRKNFPPASELRGITSRQLIDALFPNVAELKGAKALCVSHVYPSTGIQLPLALLREKADELDIEYLVVDGAQAFGMLDLNSPGNKISHTDFYACPGHKWLNGPPSTGILYLRNEKIRPPEFYPTLSQRMGKYSPTDDGTRPDFPMAEALQVRGCMNTPGFSAMLSAMEFTQKLGGSTAIEQHILGLSRELKQFIHSRAPQALVSPYKAKDLQSGLTVFFPFSWDQPGRVFSDKQTAERVVDQLLQRNIRIRTIALPGSKSDSQPAYVLRVSTALFNTRDQIEQFKYALQSVLKVL